MAEIVVLPLANYASGTYQFGPVAIADAVNSVMFKVARCTTASPTIWPDPATTLTVALEISVDGGEWLNQGGWGAMGGISPDRNGNEAAASFGGGALFPGVNRRSRGTITISNGPLRSTMSVLVD